MTRFILLLVALVVSGCATIPAPPAPVDARPRVILISIDGFRPDYLDAAVTPTLARLAREGTSGVMRPSFPTVTFPNHYTLVTGQHPDRHGIVGNTMIDTELGRFSLGDQGAVTDRRWWDDGEPIWVTAERAGLVTATMFWPGSEAAIRGVRPTHWRRFDQSLSSTARVDQALAWLDLPPDRRPVLTTLYFDVVDTAGHRHGPDAAATRAAAAEVDAAVARLVEGLAARGLGETTTLVIVSDHGMAATSAERVILLSDLIEPDQIDVVYAGAVAFINPAEDADEASVIQTLTRPHANGRCWARDAIPERLALGRHRRASAVVCMADVGWLYATRRSGVRAGTHGYDNAAPEMQAIFIAHGPTVARGRVVEGIDSVDVQPLLGRLLGIATPPGDGRAEDTLAVTAD